MQSEMQSSRRYFLADQGHSAYTPGYLSFDIGAFIKVTSGDRADRLWGKLNGDEGWIAQETFNACLFSAEEPFDLSMESQESTEDVSNDSNMSTLVINGQFRGFPKNDKADFFEIRATPGIAYFDRTQHISIIDSYLEDVLLLRPRRFGKSLTLSMLAYFHGVEHRERYDQLFKHLAVDQDVQNGTVKHNQYLVLFLDFSAVNRDPNPDTAKAGLFDMINTAIDRFYRKYASYLGNYTREQLSQMYIDWNNAIASLGRCVNVVESALQDAEDDVNHRLAGVKGIYLLADEYDAFANEYLNLKDTTGYDSIHRGQSSLKDFWACVKSSKGHQRIKKCFITGVLPLSMADATSGFNIATNVSSKRELSGFCGLSSDDVRSALKSFCSNGNVEKHFRIMARHYNGYSFSLIRKNFNWKN